MPNTAISPLTQLIDVGQSYWLDDLSREMLNSGALERRVKEAGLRGVTSNPKTFADSVQSGDLYDRDIRRLREAGHSDPAIYEHLMVDDVRRGCDVLRPVYDATAGQDGFVSIEVDPRLARDTDHTLKAARHLWQTVDRPNVMIKIPGTPEGLPAIETALEEGININITLLFSLGRYKQVTAAYLRAMDRRRTEGKPLGSVASVASFFLSRIDVLVDELLNHRDSPASHQSLPAKLQGRTALMAARQVYHAFEETFSGPQWEALAKEGARPQRPLWASTGTKNPNLPDTVYVDNLIARQTVNTMPEKTIEAFADHGTLKADAIRHLDGDPDEHFRQLQRVGIDPDYVALRLEDEGIQKFIEPFREGMASISEV
ncbi:MAG: transaldolase [Opitutales bacterium]